MEKWEQMDKPLRDLFEIIRFTEDVSAKIPGLLDEAEIYRTVIEEFAQSKRYTASILLLTEDASSLRIVETALSPEKVEAAEKAAGVRLKGYKIDLDKSSLYRQVVREGKTLQVNVGDTIAELFPRPLTYLISKMLGLEKRPSVLTPLRGHGEIIGVFGMSSTELAEHFIPSVRNLAQHISTALELADEYAERVRAQEALRESEEKARAQYKGIPIPTGTWQRVGEDFVLVDYNDVLEEITRGGIADFVGMKARDLHRNRPDIVEGLWRCFAEKATFEEEMSYRYKSTGESRHLAVRYAFVPPDLVMVHTEDITERVRAQEALWESERWLSTTLRSIGDAVIATDAQGLVSLMNPVAEELTGWDEAEAVGRPLEEVFHIVNEQTGERAESPVARVLREGVVVGLANHTLLIAKDGTKRPIADSGAPMEDENGNIIGTVLVFRDITERRQAAEEMRIKDNAIASSINAIAISNLQGNLTYVNPAFLDMWGYDDEEEVLGRSALEFWQQTAEAAELMRLVQEGEGRVGELLGVRKDGSAFDAQLSASLVIDEEGEPICMMASFVDITERKRMEEALRGSERRFRELADLLPQIVFEMDLQGNITFMNRNGLEFLGYTQEDLEAGLNALQLVIPEDRERIGQNLQGTFAGERIGGIQYTGLRKDGSTFPFIGDSSLIVRDGEPIGLRGIVIDITKRVRAEEALERRVAELRALNAMATIVNQSLEVDEILNRAMDEALRQVGVEAAAMLLLDDPSTGPSTGSGQRSGQGEAGELALGAHRGLSDEFVRTFRRMKLGEGLAGQVAETGQPSILRDLTEYPEALRSYVEAEKIRSAASVPLVGRTGAVGVMNLGAPSPEYFDAEGIALLLSLGQQMAIGLERAQLYQEARESEERFRRLSRAASEGIMIHEQAKIVEANQTSATMFGYEIPELVGMDGFELIAPESRDLVAENIASGYEEPYEAVTLRKDGTTFPAEIIGKAIPYRGRTLRVVVIRDITERKEMQERLVRSEKLAVLGKLAGGVGHELRNPLGAIKNAAYFLNMAIEEPEPEVKETLDILDKEVTTSERIISSLLDFARAKPPVRRKVDVNQVVQDALSRTDVPQNVEVVSQLDETLPIILADPNQLDQVFGNLILNAIQAMPEGGRLTIKTSEVSEKLPKTSASSVEPSGKWLAVSITDTGVGIPEENLAKVFEPLFTTRAKGIGLGLAVVKTLVEGHGGVIEVESEEGKGSMFTVRLPVAG